MMWIVAKQDDGSIVSLNREDIFAIVWHPNKKSEFVFTQQERKSLIVDLPVLFAEDPEQLQDAITRLRK